MTTPDMPYVVNPEAIGDPDQTPIVQLPPDMVAAMRAGGLICECGGMNGHHTADCPKVGWHGEVILACGHGWPGSALNEEKAQAFIDLCMATDDSARCPVCDTQQTITGPIRELPR